LLREAFRLNASHLSASAFFAFMPAKSMLEPSLEGLKREIEKIFEDAGLKIKKH